MRTAGFDFGSRLAGAMIVAIALLGDAAYGGDLRTYESPYYTIRTDLDPPDAAEASLRMTRIFEQYQQATRGFPGEIHEKFRCFLYRSRDDYVAAGGPAKSTGIYLNDVKTLMVCTGDHPTPGVWAVLQHEAFHQFAAGVIRADLPSWLNEGIAEYFGQCRFTGDGFLPGLAPPERIQRLQTAMRQGKLRSFPQLLKITREQWAGNLAIENYDQAWSIVYFMLRADDGKFAPALNKYVTLLGQKVRRETAWQQCFGDVERFETLWKIWWQAAPEDLTADEAVESQAQTFCSFMARTTIPVGGFASLDAFVRAAGTPRAGVESLPPGLLAQTAEAASGSGATFSIAQKAGESPKVIAICTDGTCVTCWSVRAAKSVKIVTDFDNVPEVVGRAAKMLDAGHREEARATLQAALRAHPKSPSADAARKLLKQTIP